MRITFKINILHRNYKDVFLTKSYKNQFSYLNKIKMLTRGKFTRAQIKFLFEENRPQRLCSKIK